MPGYNEIRRYHGFAHSRKGDHAMQTKPFFMNNPDWYYFDEEDWKYRLTDKAPKEARDSYEDFYASTEMIDIQEITELLERSRRLL